MAKTPNGLGQYSGKVGGVVYAVQNGQQIVRSYQPVISNPKSLAQRKQRAKANLVGRISQITPWQILEGLGSNRRSRRSRFLRLTMRSAIVPDEPANPDSINAKLNDGDFVFSEGSLVALHAITSVTADAASVSITASVIDGVPAEAAASQGILVVVVVKQASGDWKEILYRFVSPGEFVEGSISIELSHRSQGEYYAAVYIAPFGTIDGTKLPTISGDLTSTATSLDALLSVGSAASSVVWGKSYHYITRHFVPANA